MSPRYYAFSVSRKPLCCLSPVSQTLDSLIANLKDRQQQYPGITLRLLLTQWWASYGLMKQMMFNPEMDVESSQMLFLRLLWDTSTNEEWHFGLLCCLFVAIYYKICLNKCAPVSCTQPQTVNMFQIGQQMAQIRRSFWMSQSKRFRKVSGLDLSQIQLESI